MRTKTLSIFLACALSSSSWPQQPAAPQFEVASIKLPSTREIGGAYTYPGGRVAFRGCTLLYLIQLAFDIQAFQVTGAPAWIQDERYDIDATVPPGSKSSQSTPPYSKAPMNGEQRQMLQSLLAERFNLRYRRETREGPVYLLARGGKALKLADSKDKNAFPWSGGLGGGMIVGDGLAGINESMEDLAQRLSRYAGRPVLDRTGLPGSFDFRVEYSTQEPRPDIMSMIITCLQDIGLKLEPSKGPVETVVVEHVEKPSPN